MKKPLFGVLVILLILTCASCTQQPSAGSSAQSNTAPGSQSDAAPPQGASASPPPSSSEADSSTAGDSFTAADQKNGIVIPPDSTENTRVFDYNEFQKDKLVYGEYSVNQLVQTFGTPVKIYGYMADIAGACVSVEFPGFALSMYPLDGTLSFAVEADGSSNKEYPLTDQDKALPMNMIDQTATDPSFPLSRGLKIGTSTHDDVLAAYPSGSFADDGDSYTIYNYIWFEDYAKFQDGSALMTGIIYRYDSNGVIANVSFGWTVID